MSKLIWDDAGSRRYENGVSQCVLYTDSVGEDNYGRYTRISTNDKSDRAGSNQMIVSRLTIPEDIWKEDFTLFATYKGDGSWPSPFGGGKFWAESKHKITKEQLDTGWNSMTVNERKAFILDFLFPSSELSEYGLAGFDLFTVSMAPTLEGGRIIELRARGYNPDESTYFTNMYWSSHRYIAAGTNAFSKHSLANDDFMFDGKTCYYGVPWNGITSISASPDGAEANDLWADNMKYSSPRSIETFGMTLEAYMYPYEFGFCDGTEQPVKGVSVGQQKRKQFCLSYKTNVGTDAKPEGDYLLHLVYGLTASPSERAYETINDSPDAITFSWEMTSVPVPFTGYSYKPVSEIVIDSSKISDDQSHAVTIGAKNYILSNENFNKILDFLYGCNNCPAVMPPPDVVLNLLEVV